MAAPIYKGGRPFSKPGLLTSNTLLNTSSRHLISATATLDASAGNNSAAFMGAIRGIVAGAALTKTQVAQSGVHGVFWVTGTDASTWPKCGVLGEVHAGTTVADAAFVALRGAGSTFRAMYGVADLDPDVNGAQYGLDLSQNSLQGGGQRAGVGYTQADIRMSSDVCIMSGANAPTNGSTGAGFAGPGSLYTMTSGSIKLYQNTGSKASPTWTAQT